MKPMRYIFDGGETCRRTARYCFKGMTGARLQSPREISPRGGERIIKVKP